MVKVRLRLRFLTVEFTLAFTRSVLLTKYYSDNHSMINLIGLVRSTYELEMCIGFGGESEGKRPLGRPKGRWEANTRMYLTLVGRARTGYIWFSIGEVIT
jgi:hypothetical protein